MDNTLTRAEIHKKFLKMPSHRKLDVGDYMTDIILNDGMETVRMYELIKNDHMIAAFFSTDCDSCQPAMEALDRFYDQNSNLNIVGFVNTSEEILDMLKEYYSNKFRIFLLSKTRMNEELSIYQFPKGYTLNKLGQVLVVETCSDEYWYNKLKEPLKKLNI